MKAVVIGPGRIGCGFIGQLLHAAGSEVVFAARNPVLVEHLNRVGRYRVRLIQKPITRDYVVEGVRAVPTASPEQVAREIARADLVATAVGPSNLPDVAPLIAAGLRQRRKPLNILTFENLPESGPYLRHLVSAVGRGRLDDEAHGFAGAWVHRAVTRRIGEPGGDEPLLFIGDLPESFVVDGTGLRGPLPPFEGMMITENYLPWVQRKLYTFSAGHATVAYLGYLKGYHYIHTAIRDPEIRAAVLAAMAEGQRGLAVRYGQAFAGDESDLLGILARFENAALNDTIARVGRDPRRKLAAEDRLVGAARLAEQAGIRPEKLALAAAAALFFDSPEDPSSALLQREIEAAGPVAALQRVSALDPDCALGRLVADAWVRLANGSQKGNLLLSLDRLMWAWSGA